MLRCWRCSTDVSNGEFCNDPFQPDSISEQQRYWSYVNCTYSVGVKSVNARPVCKKLVQEGKLREGQGWGGCCYCCDCTDPPVGRSHPLGDCRRVLLPATKRQTRLRFIAMTKSATSAAYKSTGWWVQGQRGAEAKGQQLCGRPAVWFGKRKACSFPAAAAAAGGVDQEAWQAQLHKWRHLAQARLSCMCR